MTSATVKANLHKGKDKTEQEDISTVSTDEAEQSERFRKPHDGWELDGLLNVEHVGELFHCSWLCVKCKKCQVLFTHRDHNDVWPKFHFEATAGTWPVT